MSASDNFRMVAYEHPKPPVYWTGSGWTEDRAKAQVKYSFGLRELITASENCPYQDPYQSRISFERTRDLTNAEPVQY
jgi:hypothetical protein